MTPKDVTQADVAAAEREAAADAAKITALEKRVMDGDDITPAELAQAKQLAEWSQLRVEAVRQQATATAERKRQEACAALRPDIDRFADTFAVEAAAKLQAVTDAIVDYWRYVSSQETERSELLKRAVACTGDEWRAPTIPPAHNAGVGHRGPLLIAGRRRIDRIAADRHLGKALQLAARELKPNTLRIKLDYHEAIVVAPVERDADPIADLARITQAMPEPEAAHFYRGPGGAVIERDKPIPDDEIKRLRLKPISSKEAWGV